MSRKIITRRQMLYGAGGVALGLPFLRSLVPGPAYGQEVEYVAPKRFFAMTTGHGGVFESAMFPSESLLSQSSTLYTGLTVRRGSLAATVSGGQRRVSEVLRAPEASFPAELVGKMNVLWGLDIPFYIAHHSGGHLGNFARNDGNGDDGRNVQGAWQPTIDQLMAWSESFYPDIDNIKRRSIVTGSVGRMSYFWSTPSNRSGTIQEVQRSTNAQSLFNEVFVPEETMDPEEPKRPPIVDRVLENYRSLRQSNRRLSSEDRRRLDDHIDRLAELQRRVNAVPEPLAACRLAGPPGTGGNYVGEMQALLDVVVAAFLCGTSRVAVMGITESNFVADNGDWHQSVAHQWHLAEPQAKLQEANRGAFQNVLLYLARQLDVEEAPGVTVLDNSLLTWSQECGMETHEASSMPVVTFGGAGGALRTGNFCDYRNRTAKGMRSTYGSERGYSGLLYNQWLATCLLAMGVPRSEWQNIEHNGAAGYGNPYVSTDYALTHVPGVVENASDLLPFLGT